MVIDALGTSVHHQFPNRPTPLVLTLLGALQTQVALNRKERRYGTSSPVQFD